MGKYTAKRSTDGTENEIVIYSPEGRAMAAISFWDEGDAAEADAMLIVNALNAQASKEAA